MNERIERLDEEFVDLLWETIYTRIEKRLLKHLHARDAKLLEVVVEEIEKEKNNGKHRAPIKVGMEIAQETIRSLLTEGKSKKEV